MARNVWSPMVSHHRYTLCSNIRKNIWNLILLSIPLVIFLYQTQSQINEYLRKPRIITMKAMQHSANFPPLVVCPWPSFHPLRLVQLGLNTTVSSASELLGNFEKLSGLNGNLTGRKLLDTAAWRPEDVVEEVKTDNAHEIYNTSKALSSLWRRQFTPIGPCLALVASPFASLGGQHIKVKLRSRPQDLEVCMWKDGGITKQYSGPQDCLAIQQLCNRSCIWEQFIARQYYHINFIYLMSAAPSLEFYIASSYMRIDHLKYVEVQAFETVQLEDNEIPSAQCFLHCIQEHSSVGNTCKALDRNTLDNQILELCSTQHQQYKLAEPFLISDARHLCKSTCKPEKREFRWEMKNALSAGSESSRAISINLSSTYVLQLKENEAYPFSRLLSDIGGNLGLFLGLSLYDLWYVLVQSILNIFYLFSPKSKDSNTILQLSMATFTFAFIHTVIIVLDYNHQSLQMTVIIQKADVEDLEIVLFPEGYKYLNPKDLNIQDLVIAHIASRPLGCRDPVTFFLSQHLVHCLQSQDTLLLPFIEVDDLPICSDEHLKIPNMKYFVSEYIRQVLYNEKIDVCITEHIDFKSTSLENFAASNKSHVRFQLQEEFAFNATKLICVIGSIIGLYYGFSLLSSLKWLIKSVAVNFKEKNQLNMRELAGLSVIYSSLYVCAIFLLLQVHSFLYGHPVHTSFSSRRMEYGDVPAITVCTWPPFNVQKLLETAGWGTQYNHLNLLYSTNKHYAITPLLQGLRKMDNVSPIDLWTASVWSNNDIGFQVEINDGISATLETSCADCTQTFNSLFNYCKTYVPPPAANLSIDKLFYFLTFVRKQSMMTPYLAVHARDDSPYMEPDKVVTVPESTLEISDVNDWSGSHGNWEGRGRCMTQCLNRALEDHMGCILPWADSFREMPVCNMSQFSEFLVALWSLGPHPQRIYSALLGVSVTDTCSHTCHQKAGTFYRFTEAQKIAQTYTEGYSHFHVQPQVVGFSATVNVRMGSFHMVQERDGYPVVQLLSDVGGVVGMILGWSLMSLFKSLLELFRRRKTKGNADAGS